MNAKLNKRERKAAQLLAHYATCERLAAYLGDLKECSKCGNVSTNTTCPKCVVPQRFNGRPGLPNIDGKKISVALWKAEKYAAERSVDYCNGEIQHDQWEREQINVSALVRGALGKLPPGFFVNGDPRGYALKIDNETPEGKALIEAVKLHTDWGGYGILSPEIDGD